MKKLKSRAAFTFVEMLACVITLLLVCLICTTCLNLVTRSYQTSLFESNSQMLESTLHTVMGDVFRYAHNVTVSEDNTVYFESDNYIYMLSCEMKEEAGQLVLYNGIETERLVSKNVYAENLQIRENSFIIEFYDGVFSGSYVIESTILDGLERKAEFQFRTIMEK